MDQKLQMLDWIVIAVYVLGMLVVGWYFSRRTKTNEDYMLGGRTMKPWAVGLSLFATMLSTISYLATPGEVIKYGPMLLSGMLAYPLIFLVVGWVLIPSIMKMNIGSAYELLELRLGPSVRVLASVIFLVMRLMWMAVIIHLCASKVIVPIMGWSESTALWVSITMGVITIVYSSMGGLRAVVFTDVAQTFILFGGAILSLVLIAKQLGGISTWFPQELPAGWVEWKLFDTGARWSFGTAVLSFFAWWVCTAGSDQMAIQRYLATRDAKSARRMFLGLHPYRLCSRRGPGLVGISPAGLLQSQPAASSRR